MDHNKIRLEAAIEYFNRLKQDMDGGCIDCYVFGSVARGEAKPSSDVDLILVLQRPTREERYNWNTPKEMSKRNYSYNFAKNSHRIFRIQEELEKKYGFPLSINTHYSDAGMDHCIPLH
ncbi:MAG: nucleotidyltransferase domain-containing protein, partial [Atribacterota bacterium]|nr:nucleotidyltransferase domain-containing protein [Atribacterota bacterium]